MTCVRRLVVDGDRRARAEDSRGVMQRSAICHCSCLACRLTATAWRTHTQCTRCACTYVKIKCFLCKLCRLTAGFCQRVRCFVLLCKAPNMLLLGVSPPVLAAAAAQDQVDPLHTAHPMVTCLYTCWTLLQGIQNTIFPVGSGSCLERGCSSLSGSGNHTLIELVSACTCGKVGSVGPRVSYCLAYPDCSGAKRCSGKRSVYVLPCCR